MHGKVEYFISIHADNIDSDLATSICVLIDGAEKELIGTDAYDEKIEQAKDQIEAIAGERKQIRYDDLIQEATTKLNDAQAELDEEKEKAETEIAKAEKDLTDAEDEIAQAEKDLKTNTNQANAELKKAETTLTEKQEEYEEQKQEAEKGIEEAEAQIAQMETNRETIQKQLTELKASYETATEEIKPTLETQIKQLEEGIAQIDAGIQTAENTITQVQKELTDGKNQLESAQKELQTQKTTTNQQLEKAKKEIENGKTEIEDGRKELEEQKAEFEEKIAEAQEKLNDAKEKIQDIEFPKWYIQDREDILQGYNELVQEAKSIDNISRVFPIIFFGVATLMSLTSMTRMIDEERTQIGTRKALGYGKMKIAQKYILYATEASVLGNTIGIFVGFYVILPIIISACLEGYSIPKSPIVLDWQIAIVGFILSVICIVGGAIYASFRTLKDSPAELMRPEAPKPGKRVLLERITFLWKHLSFIQKVTVRNIFRYKKRFLMAIIGICGATSLLLVGYGAKDSIAALPTIQFQEIYQYQMIFGLKDTLTQEEQDGLLQQLEQREEITAALPANMQNVTIANDTIQREIQLTVVSDEADIGSYIDLRDEKTKEPIQLGSDTVILTEKIADVLEVKVGDKIKIRNDEDIEKEVTIGGITRQYISNYIYMRQSLYEEIFETELKENILFVKTQDFEKATEEKLGEEILKDYRVSSVQYVSDMNVNFGSLNFVIAALILLSGGLALLVLYNLSNINISERQRELATLKVLGFYNREIDQYVNREMIFLTLLGMGLGLIVGTLLSTFVLTVAEREQMIFPKVIEPISYVYTMIIILTFAVITNFASHFAMKKINMIDSLKSIE